VEARFIDFPWGGREFCCRTRHEVTSNRLTPYAEELSLVLDGPLRVKQLAVYQPEGVPEGAWGLRSFWDRRRPNAKENLQLTGPTAGAAFDGDLGNNCTWHAMQARVFACGPGSDPYCPPSDVAYHGWSGSKLFVLLASMPYAEDPALRPRSCIQEGEDERAQDAPWIGLGASELVRDGWQGYHPCHCFANTDAGVGDGCGQINVFEVIAEASGPRWGNRDLISTGLRSFQLGHLGGNTCGIESCPSERFPADAELVDACKLSAMTEGAVLNADARDYTVCPMWRRPQGDRYFVVLLDEVSRTVQVAVLHPERAGLELPGLLPELPRSLSRQDIQRVLALRLPH
jgi:hypothetical protein